MLNESKDIIVDIAREIENEEAALSLVMCMAVFGGLVSWLKEKGPRKISRLIVVLCTAGFAGLLAYYITNAVGLNVHYQCAMSGIAGYGGGTLLDEAVKRAKGIIHGRGK